jgi:F-type H+-transporting ATPase subunit b
MKILTTILIVVFACAGALAAEGEAGGQEQGIFSGSFADAVWTVLAFLLVLAVLGKTAWKPLLNSLKTREEHIRQQIETAENARKKAERMLDDSKHQGLMIVQQAAEQAQKQGQILAEKTRQEIFAVKGRAQEDIEHARAAAMQQLWEQAGDIALALGGKVLERTITSDDNQRLVQDAIAKLKQQ